MPEQVLRDYSTFLREFEENLDGFKKAKNLNEEDILWNADVVASTAKSSKKTADEINESIKMIEKSKEDERQFQEILKRDEKKLAEPDLKKEFNEIFGQGAKMNEIYHRQRKADSA